MSRLFTIQNIYDYVDLYYNDYCCLKNTIVCISADD